MTSQKYTRAALLRLASKYCFLTGMRGNYRIHTFDAARGCYREKSEKREKIMKYPQYRQLNDNEKRMADVRKTSNCVWLAIQHAAATSGRLPSEVWSDPTDAETRYVYGALQQWVNDGAIPEKLCYWGMYVRYVRKCAA